VLWRFATTRSSSHAAERRAQQLIAISFYVLAAYVTVEATRSLVSGREPATSWVGVGLAAFTAATMPPLAIAKAPCRRADELVRHHERRPSEHAVRLSVARTLVGLGASALLGWWWADPVTALAIAGVALREGGDAWRGEDPCCAPVGTAAASDTCACEPGCACCS
jgi:divalent metal cation (Fe/Co/Zn/Cd) transporter